MRFRLHQISREKSGIGTHVREPLNPKASRSRIMLGCSTLLPVTRLFAEFPRTITAEEAALAERRANVPERREAEGEEHGLA